jgi:hypothetical protein
MTADRCVIAKGRGEQLRPAQVTERAVRDISAANDYDRDDV